MKNVYLLNEYVYCPRRYWYIKNGINPSNTHLEEGKTFHKLQTKNKRIKNIFFQDEKIGLKGRIDYLTWKDRLILYEIKKGFSKRLWNNDKLQLQAYLMLAKNSKLKINKSYVKYGNGRKFEVKLNRQDECNVHNVLYKMDALNKLPERLKTKKCHGCNLQEYCWL